MLYKIAVGVAIGAGVGILAAWSVKRLRDRELLAPAFDGYHALATVLVIYGAAETVAAYGFLAAFAGGIAFRRYEIDHELNARVHEGAELTEKLLELSVILLLGSLLTFGGLGVPGWEGWLLAALVLVAVRPLACLARAARLAHRPRAGEGVRRLVRRARRRLALLRRGRGRLGRARGGRARRRGVDDHRLRAALGRRARRHRRAVAAAAARSRAGAALRRQPLHRRRAARAR